MKVLSIVFCCLLSGGCCWIFNLSSCKGNDYGAALQDSIELFEKNRETASAKLLTIKNITGEKPSSNAEIKTFISKMREKLSSVESDTNTLKSNFDDVVAFSQKFFASLTKKTTGIQDKKIREDTEKDIQLRRDKYTASLKKTRGSLNKLEKYLSKTKDLLTRVEILSDMSIIDQKIEEISQIAKSANDLIRELQQLTKDGLKLIGRFSKK